MDQKPKISFQRSPTERLQAILMPGEFLSPIINLNKRSFLNTELDVHFLAGDEIHAYCGLSRILTVRLLKSPSNHVRVEAHDRYTQQPCGRESGLFRRWRVGEPGFGGAVEAYLNSVEVNPRFIEGEGAVQSQWARVTEPWVPFDREGVLKYESDKHRKESTEFLEVDKAFEVAEAEARQGRWKRPERRAIKIDQLAIDRKGRLVLIELKDVSTNNDKVYYSPLQLLQYVWEWYSNLDGVKADLQMLIDARVVLGLMPPGIPSLSDRIRPVVGFAADCRTPEVRRRYEMVLDIANAHRPKGVSAIETWEHTNERPRRLR